MSSFLPAIPLKAVPVNRGISIRVGERQLAIFAEAGEVYALDAECPHKGGPLAEGFCEKGQVYCPMHGWAFALATGACTDRPDKPVRVYPARVRDGMIEVDIGN